MPAVPAEPTLDSSRYAKPGEVERSEAGREAAAAVHVGIWVSATRCVLTYVVAPALGAIGLILGPLGLLLQVAGAITATAGARRLWILKHRLRIPYVVVALSIDAITLYAIAAAIGKVRS